MIELIRLFGFYDKKDRTHQIYVIYDKNGLCPTLNCCGGGV